MRFLVFMALVCANGFATTPLDFPVFDAPFNFRGFPSMAQSQALSKDFYQAGHVALMETAGAKHRWLGALAVGGFDVLASWLPLGNAWVHEEWHRAVLTRRGIGSQNDVYKFPLFQNEIAVSHLLDSDLVALKRYHPAESVRLQEAGFESEYELNFRLEKDAFFRGDTSYNRPLLWLNYVGTSVYLFTCASDGANASTDEQNQHDGTDVPKRDFTGLDCTGWVYDLHRPDEPYEVRGVHPSGVGINRYRKNSDLSDDERRFLSEQAYLSLLNIIDPNLFGFGSFGDETRWNLTVRHHLTSFGYTVDENLFLAFADWNALLILHEYFNRARIYPGVEAQVGFSPFHGRAMAWAQPAEQRFDARTATLGGLLGFRYDYALTSEWGLYAEVEGKTAGWVAGNVYLDANVSLRVGAEARLF